MTNSGPIGPFDEEEKPAEHLRQEHNSAGIENLPSKLQRYAGARHRSLEMAEYLRTLVFDDSSSMREQQHAHRAASKLCSCGEWIALRHYWAVDQVKLIAGDFCQQTKLCPFCAIRRGARNMSAYLKRYEFLMGQKPHLKAFLVTLTVKNGSDLRERMEHLRTCYRRLIDGRRQSIRRNGAGGNPFAGIVAGVGSFEVTNNGKGWHPHVHTIVLAESPPDQVALSDYWRSTSGDSFIVDVRQVDPFNPASGFCEVFKYAMKFQGLALADNWRAHLDLKGFRMLMAFGDFYGVKLPSELTDDPLEDQPYVDLFFRYLAGSNSYSYDKDFNASKLKLGGRGQRLRASPPAVEATTTSTSTRTVG